MSTSGRPRSTEIDERIVEVTRALIEAGGIEAVTIAGVAAGAGVGRPTVYRRYANRTLLARAVLTHDLEELAALVAEPVDGPVEDRVMGMLLPFMAYYAEKPERSRALLKESILNEGGLNEPMNRVTMGWAARLMLMLGAAQAKGELDPAIDVETAVQAIFSTYLVSVLGGLNGLYPDAETQIESLRRCVVQHLRR